MIESPNSLLNMQGFSPDILTSPKKYNINKVRGNYSRTVKNKKPAYHVPESHKKRLAFINEVVELSQARDVTKSDVAMYTRTTQERKKCFYPDRANAIRTLHTVFCEHVNLVTHQVEISLRNASDEAGLSTTSENELKKADENKEYTPVPSISRASRAFKDMVLLGWIIAHDSWQVWDKARGYWIDKYFEVTPLFFEAVGITAERVIKQQSNRLKYLQKQALERGMTAERAGRMSIVQLKLERKLAWRRGIFERRSKEQSRSKVRRDLKEKSIAGQRSVAQLNVIKALGPDIHSLSALDFKGLVNKEIAMLRKFSDLKPPLH
ncbi:hypothetical protein JI57_04655 [Psychromonas sp. PRT-SC03]|nr:hypothetical protein JI57_04655 [Psychromonas sp. PRT-SC03]